MRVAGFGLRPGAGIADLQAALEAAQAAAGAAPPQALATAADKAAALAPLARALALPLIALPRAWIAAETRAALFAMSPARYGHRRPSEASALAALGPAARLVAPATPSPDGKATCALAEATLSSWPKYPGIRGSAPESPAPAAKGPCP
jgi:cobalt-precorrin 5A hydrolase